MTARCSQRGFHLATAMCAAVVACVGSALAQDQQILRQTDSDDLPRIQTGELVPQFDDEDAANVEISPELLALVDELDAPNFEQRERAFERLLEFEPELDQLRALLRDGELNLEQRHRLLQAARLHLIGRPRGAVGIRMQPRLLRDGDETTYELEVMELLPDLPARRVLRLGDRITQVNGRPLRNSTDLLRAAQEREPGDTITLTVRRIRRDELGNAMLGPDGAVLCEQVTVDLVLGTAENLVDEHGTVQRTGPVVEERETAANRLRLRFGSPTRRLAMDPDAPQRAPGDVVQEARGVEFRLVEQHRYVQAMIREKKQIEDGRVKRAVIARTWQARLIDLQRQISDRSLSASDRRYLRAVYDRCFELMRE